MRILVLSFASSDINRTAPDRSDLVLSKPASVSKPKLSKQ